MGQAAGCRAPRQSPATAHKAATRMTGILRSDENGTRRPASTHSQPSSAPIARAVSIPASGPEDCPG